MAKMPFEKSLESTWALLADPYRYIGRRAAVHGSDVFTARIFLRKTICLTGPEAAELMCDNRRFERKKATPLPIQKTLVGRGGVQGLDGQSHDHRKQMFLNILSPQRVDELVNRTSKEFETAFNNWSERNQITLYHETQTVLCRAVCDWAGVPLEDSQLPRRTRQLVAMFDKAASKSPWHFWSRIARRRSQAWIRKIIRDIRNDKLSLPKDSAARVIAEFRDGDGHHLKRRIAAVELLNVLRPVVAVSVFLTDAVLALHLHPQCVEKLRDGENEDYLLAFVQEVRRYFPFFPIIAAKVKMDFEWKGFEFKKGTPALLDVYGTNRDSRTWSDPDIFRPERFLEKDTDPFNFLPQGPGDYLRNHRCPGEPLTIELMKMFVKAYISKIRVEVPPQDLEIEFSRMPALPRSRILLRIHR